MGTGAYAYEADHDWGRLPAGLAWGNTHGVVQDAQGHMYVHHTVHATSERPDTVVVFDQKGNFVRSWGKEFRGVAHGLHIRKEGKDEFLYLTANAANPKMTPQPGKQAAVVKTTLKGEVVWSIDAPPAVDGYKPAADGTAAKYNPTNVAIAPNGDVYVADGYGSFYINQYNAKAKHIRTFGGRGAEPGKLIEPHGIWMDTRGASPVLVVADRRNNRLQRFTLDGAARRLHPRLPAAVPLRRAQGPGRRARPARPRDAARQAERDRRAPRRLAGSGVEQPAAPRAAREVHPGPVHLPARRLLRPRRQHLRRRVGRGRPGDEAAEGLNTPARGRS